MGAFKDLSVDLKKVLKDKVFHKVLKVFILLKIVIILAAVLGYFMPAEYSWRDTYLDNKFLNLFAQYDSSSYLDIVANGYNGEFMDGVGNYSYYPLYPIIVYFFSFLFGIGWSAFIVSNILSLLAVILMYIVIKEDYGNIIAKRSTMYFLFFPLAYFLTVMYTESLFMVLILLMFYFAKRGSWLTVGILGFMASLTRMFGVIMFFPMAYMYLKSRNFDIFKWKDWKSIKKKISLLDYQIFYLPLIGCGFIALQVYFYFLTGNLFSQFDTFNQPIYSFRPAIPGAAFVELIVQLFTQKLIPEQIFYFVFNLAFAGLFIWATIKSFKLKIEYGLFMVFYFLLATAHTSVSANVRYYMLMFPAYILLAKAKDKWNIFIVFAMCISVGLMILFMIRHVNEGSSLIPWAIQIFEYIKTSFA